MAFYVYILQSLKNGQFYIGQTANLKARLAYHNSNYSKALRNRGPWNLVHFEEYSTRTDAVRRERYLKSLKDRKLIAQLVRAVR